MGEKSPLYDSSSPRDEESWKTLCQAAEIQHFQPIIHTAENSETNFSNIKYHRDCRSNFTHKKKLLIVKKQEYINEQDSLRTRHSTRQASSTQSRVYDTICIFCQSKSKYIKGTNSREPLKPAVELRADKTIRDIATELQDDRILSITAEAHYHKTCYRNYTRGQTERISSECSGADNPYQKQERAAFNKVCEYIRTDVFSNPRIVALSDLTAKVVCFMESNGFEVTEATKITCDAISMQSLEILCISSQLPAEYIYIRPDNLTVDSIAVDYVQLKEEYDILVKQQDLKSMITQVAQLLREQVNCGIKEQPWPLNPRELNITYISFPDCLVQFLNLLLNGKNAASSRNERLSWSIAQDIVTAVSAGKVITSKHILIPWVIKTPTGNVELIKFMNRLGHASSYSTLEEIETALCIEKLKSAEDDHFPLPSNIHSFIPTVLSFDNIDRQEEVLSGAGTSHRVNGIIIQPT